jgi:hypothetical protein
MIPRNEQNTPLKDLLSKFTQFDRFIRLESDFERIFAKFEEKEYIHAFESHDSKVIRVCLPRYSLNFEIENKPRSRMSVDEHRGFFLASTQQTDALPVFFTRYLLLENENSGRINNFKSLSLTTNLKSPFYILIN